MTDTGDTLAPGTRLGELEIERVLGAGGFGVTYLARDLSLDAWRAVKEYLPRDWGTRQRDGTIGPRTGADAEDYEWGLTRFLEEARILARFDHPNLVRVHRVFEARGTAYMVMEYVEGRTLKEEVKETGPLPEERVREVLAALTEGLAAVHGAELLHRDIKPENVMVRPDGTAVLVDFGAARQAVGGHSRSLTAVLTPGYAPIEQYSGRGHQGPWTDIYALGALAYEALSGQVPEDATERVLEDRLRPLGKVAPQGVSAGLAAGIDAALAVDGRDRPQSLGAWRELLAGTAGVSPVSLRPRSGKSFGTAAPSGVSAGNEAVGAERSAAAWRRWWLPGAAAAGLVGVALVVALNAPWNGGGPDPPVVDPNSVREETLVEPDGGTVAADQAAADQAAAEQAAADQAAADQAAAEQAAAEQAAAEQAAAEQAAAEQAAADQAAAEQAAAEQAAAEQAAADQAAADQAAADQAAADQAAADQAAAEQAAADQAAAEQAAAQRQAVRADVPEMVVIPAGRFRMGCVSGRDCEDDELPVHEVTVASFALSKYEVTFEEYDRFTAATGGRRADDGGWGRGTRPVINVSWNDAQAYAAWLSAETGETYRLPSEAEWEYAARAGTATAYSWGNEIGRNRANCDGCGSRGDDEQTAPVGSFGANAWGLHDMHGNVWEWVEDCWHGNYARAPTDGTAWASGVSCARRVLRGGSWYDVNPRLLRSAIRSGISTGFRFNLIGFRVARTLTP